MADKYNANRLAFRKSRIDAGLCRDCGKIAPIPNKVVCLSCFNKRKIRQKSVFERNKKNNICHYCNGPSRPNKTVCLDCNEKIKNNSRIRRKENKEFIIKHFGGKCLKCGEYDIRCLTLDHVNNDGNLEDRRKDGKRKLATDWYRQLVKLIKSGLPLPRQLQLLCYNCHARKDLSPWWLK